MVETSLSAPAGGWRTRLARWLGLSPVPADVAGELAALRATVARFAQAQAEAEAASRTLHETVDRLERQIARAGKEQFKANNLADTQQQQVKAMLEQLRDAERYRERELADLRERLSTARRDGRMEIIQRLLPVADGLDEAVASGTSLLADLRTDAPAQVNVLSRPAKGGLGQVWARLWGRTDPFLLSENASQAAYASDEPLVAAKTTLAAWLEGLMFVRDRLFDTLAAEGVYPIEVEGDIFDPHLHVAIETVTADNGLAPGAIVRETRRGYQAGETILRYAEVVVAR